MTAARCFASHVYFLTAPFLLLLKGFHTPVRADMIIDVQFTGQFNGASPVNASGAAVIGRAGDQWNHVFNPFASPSSGSGIALYDNNGSATGVSLAYSGSGGYNVAGFAGGVSNTPNPALTSQYLYGIQRSITMTISGLNTGQLYDLYVYSSADPAPASGQNPRPASISANNSPGVIVTANPLATTFTAGANYAPFLELGANSSGQIQVVAVANLGFEVDINGFQLVAIPEPSSFILMGLFAAAIGVGLLPQRMRHKQLTTA